MTQNFLSRKQLDLLPSRISAVTSIQCLFESEDFYEFLDKIRLSKHPMRILICGSGGSYSATALAKYFLQERLVTPYIEIATPQTALRMIKEHNLLKKTYRNFINYSLVIGISYSGITLDIQAVKALCHEIDCPFTLITGTSIEELKNIYNINNPNEPIFSYYSETCSCEKGLISMAATLLPAIIYTANVYPRDMDKYYFDCLNYGENFVAKLDIHKIAMLIKKDPIIHVFYDSDSMPTAIDIESKFIESGIANVILHEKKNFSHGRFTALFNLGFAVIINPRRYHLDSNSNINDSDYDIELTNFLTEICDQTNSYYLEFTPISKEYLPAFPYYYSFFANLSTMSILPYLITTIGEELNIDISRPLNPMPKRIISLYNYKGRF